MGPSAVLSLLISSLSRLILWWGVTKIHLWILSVSTTGIKPAEVLTPHWVSIFKVTILLPLWHSIDSCIISTVGGGGERTRRRGYGKDEERLLNEEHLVFTGGGTRRGFRSGGEGGYDGGKDDVWALSGVDGRVQAPGAVVLHQRDGLPVVGVQTGAQRRLVVVAAADERLACQLSAEKMGLQRGSKTWTTMHASFNLFLQLGQGSHLAFLLAHTLLVPVLKSLSWSEQKLLEITASFLSRGIECHCVLLCMESQ